MSSKTFVPFAEDNPFRVSTFMTVEEWKQVVTWYSFSVRSLLPDGRWFEHCRCKSSEQAYGIMKKLWSADRSQYFILVQGLLTGNDGREKVTVFMPGTEQTVLNEIKRRKEAKRL